MTTYQRASNVDSASVIKVIQVFSVTGAGVEGDPVRRIIEYYSLDGELLAWRDPYKTITKSPCGIPLPTTPVPQGDPQGLWGLPGAGAEDKQTKGAS